MPRVFIGSWSLKHPLPSTFRTPRRKAGVSINHIVYKVGSVRHSLIRAMGASPTKSRFPNTSQDPSLEAVLLKTSSEAGYVNSSGWHH